MLAMIAKIPAQAGIFGLPHKSLSSSEASKRKLVFDLSRATTISSKACYAFGRASETVSMRPPKSLPFHIAIAPSAPASSAISTKPKPRERPVSRSVTMLAEATSPALAKASRSSSPVARYGRPPTKSLRAMITRNKITYCSIVRRPSLTPNMATMETYSNTKNISLVRGLCNDHQALVVAARRGHPVAVAGNKHQPRGPCGNKQGVGRGVGLILLYRRNAVYQRFAGTVFYGNVITVFNLREALEYA